MLDDERRRPCDGAALPRAMLVPAAERTEAVAPLDADWPHVSSSTSSPKSEGAVTGEHRLSVDLNESSSSVVEPSEHRDAFDLNDSAQAI